MTWLAGQGFQGVHPAPRSPTAKNPARRAFIRVGDCVIDLPPAYASLVSAPAPFSPVTNLCDECGVSLESAVMSSATWMLRCTCGRIYPVRWREAAGTAADGKEGT